MIPLAFAAKALPFLRTYWKEIAVGGIVLALALGFWMRGQRIDTLEARLVAEKARYEQQVSDYRAAYNKARADALAAARKVETEQERITHEVSADYQARLADVRARYSRLLAEANADSRDAGEADLPGVSDATGGPDDGPAYCGLSLETRLVASEQALQLQALQDWLWGQVAVER
jgi:hypothetical protein